MAEQSDRLILGKLLSLKMLGIYTIAYTLANIPKEVIKKLSYRVIFSYYLQSNRLTAFKFYGIKFLRQRGLILMGCAVGLAALTTVGDLIIAILYDSRYVEANMDDANFMLWHLVFVVVLYY